MSHIIRRLAPLGLGLALAGCSSSTPPGTWTVVVSRTAPEAVGFAASDVVTYLGAMGEDARLRRVSSGNYVCEPGVLRVVFGGDGVDAPPLPAGATDQTFRHRTTVCGDGRLVSLSGGGLLGRQYAAYEWLRSLGVRYFHPEQEYVPARAAHPAADTDVARTPSFRDRSVSLHLTHPLELGDAFRLGDETYFPEARRYIDWQVKNLASLGHGGVGSGDLADYGHRRGFPRTTGLRLYGQQQGSSGIIDPDSPVPWQQQIDAAIDARMVPVLGRAPTRMTVSFDPSEFTEEPDDVVLAQLTYIAEQMAARFPDVRLDAIDHGTHGDPTATYGIRYYDLPTLAPTNMGISVHTLMFYDLFRPAPVYGNTDFTHFFDLIAAESQRREITYFPESAWWLTFDIAVPLYLPITVEARDRDIQGLRPFLSAGLTGHHVFGTGHEWGYWQNEYCSFRMAADVSVRWQDCFRDLTDTFGAAATETQAVLEEVVANQATFMFDARAIRWLVGSDDETEAAALIGVTFHPLPPSPGEILRWTQAEVDDFRTTDEALLQRIEDDFGAYVYRLQQVRPMVDTAALSFFDEILDGVEMFAVRARHQRYVYGGLARLRASQLAASQPLRDEATAYLGYAKDVTQQALTVVARREAGYRYLPLDRSIAGGPNGGEDANWSTYAYRYLNRTHHAFYFRRIDDLATLALEGSMAVYEVADAIRATGESHTLRVLDPTLVGASIAWGDGATDPGAASVDHAYASSGLFTVSLTGMRGTEPFAETIPLARVDTETHTGFSGTVVSPAGADLIEGLLPALVFGPLGGGELALGFSAEPDHDVLPTLFTALTIDGASSTLATLPEDVYVPIVAQRSGTVYTRISVQQMTLTYDGTSVVTLTGSLATDSVVDAVVTVGNGAFDPDGARAIVASTLGYTVATLPALLPFVVTYAVVP